MRKHLFQMELERRKLILNKYIENPLWSNSRIAKCIKMPKSTVNDAIKGYKNTLTVERAIQVNRKSGPQNQALKRKVIQSIKSNPGLSDYDRAKKFNAKRSTVRNIRVYEGYTCYRAIKYPNRTDKQNTEAKKRSRLLYDKILTKFDGCILMDDETYVKLDFQQLPGQKFYAADKRGCVPEKYKYQKCDKFAKKVMIWQGICSCGSKTDVFITSETMTSDVYIAECLKKRILPFIKEHRSSVKFWPDLAACHYSKKTVKWYIDNNVDYIPKEYNPPNCPQFRPIEKFWAIMKLKLKKSGGSIKNVKTMRSSWKRFASKVEPNVVQNLMRSIKKKVRDFIHNK